MTRGWFDFPNFRRETELTTLVTRADRPNVRTGEPQIISIDWLVHLGGWLRARFEEELENVPHETITLRIAMKPDPVLKFEIASWRANSKLKIRRVIVNNAAWQSEIADAVLESSTETMQDLEQWYQTMGLPQLDAELNSRFFSEMTAAGVDLAEPPWIFWSRLPPWLRRRQQQKFSSELLEMDGDLTYLRVALSPQDEVGERASLQGNTLMVNPTFDFNESVDRDAPLYAYARFWDRVSNRALTKLEASILDHVRESFRIDRTVLVRAISAETGVHQGFVNAEVEGLIADFFILGRANSGQ